MTSGFGAFDAPPLRFVVDDGYTPIELDEMVELAVEDLDVRLAASGRLPPLDGAPIASWVLARLGRLVAADDASTEARLALSSDTVEHVDDAVYVVDFVVTDADAPIAKLQVQGGMIGVGLLGVARTAGDATRAAEAFEAALLGVPADVAACRIRVIDPARGDDGLCVFGWDRERYLGRDNPRAGLVD